MDGTGNNLLAIQNGNNNRIVQELIASDDIRSQLLQQGNNNEIVTVLEGIQGQTYSIRQIGDGQKIIIRQSAY